MDVDGTLTDGKIYMGANGELMKAFDIKDGYGIHDMLMPGGVEPVIITGRFSDILKNRCGCSCRKCIQELYQIAYFDKKSTVDYIGVVQEIPVCFDAKECNTKTFPLSNIHKHQYDFMYDFEKQGGISFLIILFNKESIVYYLRFDELKKYWAKKKDIHFDDLDESYMLNVKGKIKVDLLSRIQLDLDER